MNNIVTKVSLIALFLIIIFSINVYAVNENLEENSDLYLTSLKVEGYNFFDEFDSNRYVYNLKINDKDCTSLKVNAQANKDDCSIEVVGADKIKNGENTINVIITSKDLENAKVYQILVEKNDSLINFYNIESDKIIAGGIFIVATFLLILILIKTCIKHSKKDRINHNEKERKNRERRKGKH